MTPISLNQLLIVYTWFPLATLLFFLLLIARFYQKFSGEQMYFRLFVLPITLFGMAAVRYTSIREVTGDALGDMLLAAAGMSLMFLCGVVYRRMTRGAP